jgi:predicted cupin superfamily sugar epimerase
MTPENVIKSLKLEPHPEGGWYREVHRSELKIGGTGEYPAGRTALTAIYFLLKAGEFSALHTVKGEEVWIHMDGDPLELITIDGVEAEVMILGQRGNGYAPMTIVPPDMLQAARSLGVYSLAVCMVAPGFEFEDFELPPRDELIKLLPGHTDLIKSFTRA